MANKKKTGRLNDMKNFVSKEEEIKKDIILPAIEDHLRDQIISLRETGFDNNRIAARLMIQKSIVEKIK
tara:strand:- start:434 stop:640 length:207 start_codon:yes stop_codon:yes gene_type:complete